FNGIRPGDLVTCHAARHRARRPRAAVPVLRVACCRSTPAGYDGVHNFSESVLKLDPANPAQRVNLVYETRIPENQRVGGYSVVIGRPEWSIGLTRVGIESGTNQGAST